MNRLGVEVADRAQSYKVVQVVRPLVELCFILKNAALGVGDEEQFERPPLVHNAAPAAGRAARIAGLVFAKLARRCLIAEYHAQAV